MPNDYFQFKQFRIEQGACAQKVSTDACLLGAAAPLAGASRILDVGTGTGLLALMAAQRAPGAIIEAVEIDPVAAAQAAANAAASPWAGRIRVWALSLAAYAASQPALFSHIICNPPFFRQSLPSPNAARTVARHAGTASLTYRELATFGAAFLLPTGTLSLLLPPGEMAHFEREAWAVGLATQARLMLRHQAGGRATRCIQQFGREWPATVAETELAIKAADGQAYSPAFQALLADFYLALS